MLELLQNIATLDSAAELLEEIIIVNNASTDDYAQVKNFIQNNQQLPLCNKERQGAHYHHAG